MEIFSGVVNDRVIGLWVAAILTFFIFTYIVRIKQNIFFKFAESTIVGAALGYTVVLVMAKNIDGLIITQAVKGNFLIVIPVILGLLLYFRFAPNYQYLARIPVAIIGSVGIGVGARAALDAQIVKQMIAVSTLKLSADMFKNVNNIIILLCGIFTVIYFFFTLKPTLHRKIIPITTTAQYILFIYFGAKFGGTIFGRAVLLLGRLQFLLFDWLGIG